MNKVAASQTTTEKSALNLETQFNKIEQRFNAAAKAAADYEAVQRKVNAAVAQNPALMERGNAILAEAASRYGQLSRTQQIYAEAQGAINAQAQAFAGQLGGMGQALGSIGTVGLAAAAGIGAVVTAFKAASDQAHDLGQKAVDLKKFSDVTGFSTNQVQALRIEAGKLGISSEDAESAMQRFTISFEELRQGGGRALEVLRRYKPDIADQMQQTESAARAVSLLSQAFQGLSVSEQNALSRAFGGRGTDPRLFQINLQAATQAFGASGRGLSTDQIEQLNQLMKENIELTRQWKEGFAKLFAADLLTAENEFLRTLIDINAELKKVSLPLGVVEGLKQFALSLAAGPFGGLAAGASKLMTGPQGAVGAGAGCGGGGGWGATAEEQATGKLIAAQLEDYQRLKSVLGELTSVVDIVLQKELELAVAREKGTMLTREATDSILAHTHVLAEFAQVAPSTYERQLAALNDLKAAYPGLTAAEAQRMQQLDQQLALVSAVTNAERMRVQAAITFQQEIAKGATEEQAAVVAAKQMAIAQAQINVSAQQRLITAQQQYSVASATTQQAKLEAQEQVTITQLVQQGVSAELAAAVAAQERANAEAQIAVQFEKQLAMAQAVTQAEKIALMDSNEAAIAQAEANSNVERRVQSLRDQNDLLRAGLGLEGEAKILAEGRVQAQQAYNNALREGASEMEAQRIKVETVRNTMLKAAEAAQQESNQVVQGMDAAQREANAYIDEMDRKFQDGLNKATQAWQGFASEVFNVIKALHELGQTQFDIYTKFPIQELPSNILDQMKQRLKDAEESQRKSEQAKQTQTSGQDELRQLQEQARVIAAATDEEKARVEAENKYQELIRGGTSAGLARQIADQQLANALAELAKNTKDNTLATADLTSTMQDILSPYYATDPRLSHIGFRSDSGKLDYDPFKLKASGTGAPEPVALPVGSTLPSVPSPSIVPTPTPTPTGGGGHWAGGGPGPIYWVGTGPPDYNSPEYRRLQASQGIAGDGEVPIQIPQPPSLLPARGPGGTDPLTGTTYQGGTSARPIQIVQNFNAPISQDVMSQMKMTAFQGAQSGLRQARMGGAFKCQSPITGCRRRSRRALAAARISRPSFRNRCREKNSDSSSGRDAERVTILPMGSSVPTIRP